jgi:hypothetical protein
VYRRVECDIKNERTARKHSKNRSETGTVKKNAPLLLCAPKEKEEKRRRKKKEIRSVFFEKGDGRQHSTQYS